MDNTRKFSVILTPEDLKPENIKTTVKTIEHNLNKFYLLKSDWNGEQLCYIVEELGKYGNDVNFLTKARIAYDLDFKLTTVLKIGNSDEGTKVNSLADLLELLDFNENLMLNREDYHVIIDDDNIEADNGNDEASRAVAKLFQQIIFLNLNLDIQKKSEIKTALTKERFRANYPELLKEVKEDKEYLASAFEHADLSEEGKERVFNMAVELEGMLEEFQKAKKRPLRIAAMGTKKAGKSVVINSLLKRDYAPTSSTLPTPNTIKYIPVNSDAQITLEYDGKKYTFATAKDISEFIGDQFKAAQKITGEGAGLSDMTIYYPSEDLNGFEIWDTPGPNVAFTDEHRKNAEKCIKEADVCIFVMNYSNHLTNDEVNFLKQIHQTFKENNKFYSLFIAVNRIDERYAVNEEKSVSRILDYVSGRLENLNPPFKNIITFGTSALQSFYLDQVIDLVKADRKADGEDENELPLLNPDAIRPLKRNHQEDLTQIKFIGDALGNLEDFHNISNPTEKEVYAFSGIPQLWRYTQYIGSEKADNEIVNHVTGKCETKFAAVNNALLVTELLELADEDKKYLLELGDLIKGLSLDVQKAVDKVRSLTSERPVAVALNYINKSVKSQHTNALLTGSGRSKDVLSKINFTESDIQNMAKGYETYNIIKLKKTMGDIIFGVNKTSVNNLENSKKSICGKHIKEVEKGLQEAQSTIYKKTEEVKAKVKNSTAQNIMKGFKVPEFPSSIDRLGAEFENVHADLDKNFLKETAENSSRVEYETKYETKYRTEHKVSYRQEEQKREARGIWENIRSFFGKDYYETVDVPYTESFQVPYEVPYVVEHNVYETEKFKRAIAREIEGRIEKALNASHEKMEAALKEDVKNIFKNITDQCNEITESYTKLYKDFETDIRIASDTTSEHKKALERDIKTLEDAKKKLQPFFDMWDYILHGTVKE